MAILVYNALLIVVDLAFLAVARRVGWGARGALLVAYGVVAALVGVPVMLFGFQNHLGFVYVQLCAWAFFVHGALLGAGVAFLDARDKRSTAWGGAAFTVALAVLAAHAFVFEPRRLEITETTVHARGVTRPVRIALVADLQTDAPGAFERRALEAVRDADPDLVLFTGDYLQVRSLNAYLRARDELNAILRDVGLAPPLGAYAVRGDTEPARVAMWGPLFAGTVVEPIAETSRVDDARLADAGIELGALDRDDSRHQRLALSPREDGRFRIVFGHAPENALSPHDADLVLAGHTHGGQVRIPFFGPIITASRVPRAMAAGGLHPRPHGGLVYVSRGIGMERGDAPRLRILCRPEVALLDLVPTEAPLRSARAADVTSR